MNPGHTLPSVEEASKAGRLYLTRTKGSLSAGTRVEHVQSETAGKDTMYLVQAPIVVQTRTAPGWKRERHPVWVTRGDLVIRRKMQHPNSAKHNRRQRRAMTKLEQLKREVGNT